LHIWLHDSYKQIKKLNLNICSIQQISYILLLLRRIYFIEQDVI